VLRIMHMADALISPAVGGAFWMVSGGLIAHAARKVKQSSREDIVPMMGIMGAFVFAAQMINFAIPGTGSSGHLGGGLMLAMLLGPHAAFLVMASVLATQALFFADGGLLALGCNIFNLGFLPAYVAYPLFRRWLEGSRAGLFMVLAATAGLLAGALMVVAQTLLSGITELPAGTFTLIILPIHVAIGIVEGLATVAVVSLVRKARPGAVPQAGELTTPRPAMVGLVLAAVTLGVFVSWFASGHPDGLEWSIAKTAGTEEIVGADSEVHTRLAGLQEKTSFLPDYGFAGGEATEEVIAAWPAIDAGTSVSGLLGGFITLAFIVLAGLALRRAGAPREA
jgi:cobalt/nickel transport system permease protein